MPAYTPQGLFPPIALNGGGYVPAQVMLGIAAQESNLWQAARFAVPGVTANPLIGNYYGLDIYNEHRGRRLDDPLGQGRLRLRRHAGHRRHAAGRAGRRPGETALAVPEAAGGRAGLRRQRRRRPAILQDKWNQTRDAGLTINNGDPAKIENWFFAVWAYNSGFHPQTPARATAPWGVGWANNPANPQLPGQPRAVPGRRHYDDAAHPQDWPYPEKVMGWAGHPVEVLEAPDTLVAGYRPAWWNGGDRSPGRRNRQPGRSRRCTPVLRRQQQPCEPGQPRYLPDAPRRDRRAGRAVRAHATRPASTTCKCWYHRPVTWKPDCALHLRQRAAALRPRLRLPGRRHRLPAALRPVRPAGRRADRRRRAGRRRRRSGPTARGRGRTHGTFTLTFRPTPAGSIPGKIDTHQLGGGFGGHFWFTHTRTGGALDRHREVAAEQDVHRRAADHGRAARPRRAHQPGQLHRLDRPWQPDQRHPAAGAPATGG